MSVVNRLGGDSKMDMDELNRLFNDSGVNWYICQDPADMCTIKEWVFCYRQVTTWLFTFDLSPPDSFKRKKTFIETFSKATKRWRSSANRSGDVIVIRNNMLPLNFSSITLSQEVEPMYRESDHMHAIALTSALKVGVRVIYLDRGEATPPAHDFPEGCPPSVNLLYRPGHYDVLYEWFIIEPNL